MLEDNCLVPRPMHFYVSHVHHFTKREMWLEALPPFIIIGGCITVTGIALKYLDKFENKGKVSSSYPG